jgi:Uma2 family endonuclease
MGIPEHDKSTIDEFLDVTADDEGRYELVDGNVYAMAGASEGHNVIASNVQTALVPAGKKAGCRTTSSDTAVKTGPATIRYPDVVVDCGPRSSASKIVSSPAIIVEISSPTTAYVDYGAKLREYQALESVQTYVQIESEFALVTVHSRQSDGSWTHKEVEDFETAIDFPSIATSVTLKDIYDTVDVHPRARLKVVKSEPRFRS